MELKILLVILVCVVSENKSANILGVFPIPSISHQIVFRKITKELANRGHDITIITPDPAYPNGDAPHNYNEIDVHDISYKIIRQFMMKQLKITGMSLTFQEIREMSVFIRTIFQLQFETKGVQELISQKKKIDLILVESMVRPALIYSYIFKAPVILVSSFTAVLNNNMVVGSPTHPLLYPTSFRHKLYNLSLTEKILELYTHYSIEYADYLNEQDENIFLKEIYGPQCPSIHDLNNNVDMLLLNINSIWADNQPVAPNVIYMGGIHQLPAKELPTDLKTYLDSSTNGVIYVSFGSNVLSDMIPHQKDIVILNVLSKLPYDILLKWDNDKLPIVSSNIRTSKWLPQSDLLRHDKIKLFITQAGLQSTDEAISAGVPLVAIPMLADQWYNAEKYEKYGIGIKLAVLSMTEEKLEKAIKTVINNDSYRQNIIKLRGVMRDQPETPLNRTMWWIEYALRHQGAKHLRSPASNMSYAAYFEIEVLILVFAVVMLSFIVFTQFFKFLLRFIIKILSNSRKIKSN